MFVWVLQVGFSTYVYVLRALFSFSFLFDQEQNFVRTEDGSLNASPSVALGVIRTVLVQYAFEFLENFVAKSLGSRSGYVVLALLWLVVSYVLYDWCENKLPPITGMSWAYCTVVLQ